MQSPHLISFNQKSLLCKNDCGFYGNQAWKGYCSKCFRDYQRNLANANNSEKPQPSIEHAKNKRVIIDETANKDQSFVQISKLSSFFPLSPSSDATKNLDFASFKINLPNRLASNVAAEESLMDLYNFLLPLGKSVMLDLKKSLQIFLNIFWKKIINCENREDMPSDDELSNLVLDFYNNLYDKVSTVALYKHLTSAQIEAIMDFIEKYIFLLVYQDIFHTISSKEEEKDLEIQEKIRKLGWFCPQLLDDIGFDEKDLIIQDYLDQAITDIIEMNARITPQQKLHCVYRCSKQIFCMLSKSCKRLSSSKEAIPSKELASISNELTNLSINPQSNTLLTPNLLDEEFIFLEEGEDLKNSSQNSNQTSETLLTNSIHLDNTTSSIDDNSVPLSDSSQNESSLLTTSKISPSVKNYLVDTPSTSNIPFSQSSNSNSVSQRSTIDRKSRHKKFASGADEFLPALIYVILQANPPMLQSNMIYISKFCYPNRLLRGEAGYYFTNLCCAISFIQNLDCTTLKISPAEYDSRMNGTYTQISPLASNTISTTKSTDTLITLSSPLSALPVTFVESPHTTLLKTDQRQTQVVEETEKLTQDMIDFKNCTIEKIRTAYEDDNLQ